MNLQKDAVIRLVEEQKQQGRKVGEVLATFRDQTGHVLSMEEGCGRNGCLTRRVVVDAA